MICFKLTRAHTLAILLFLAIAANLISSACGIKKPQAPSWNTTWDLPLANRTFTVAEILDDINDSNIVFNDSGNPSIEFSQQLDTIAVDQSLKIDGSNLDLRDSVGTLEIAPPAEINSFTNLNDIIDISLGFVPPAPFGLTQSLQRIESFTWAHIEQGLLNVTFHNALEIDLDTFIVTLVDSSDMHTIGTLSYQDGLRYLETETQQIDISGQTISNRIIMLIHGHTPGGVLLNAGAQRLESTIFFPSNIMVSAASAQVQEFTHVKTGNYEINDSTKIVSSVIYRGSLNLHISNYTDLPYDITLHSSNFRAQGNDFSMHQALPANNSADVVIDLTGYTFMPVDDGPNQMVLIDMINTVPSSGPNEYVFHSSDSLSVHGNISQVLLESVNGRIAPTRIPMDTITQTLELPDGLDQAGLTHANFSLTLNNNCMVPALINITIAGNGREMHLDGIISGKSSPDGLPAVTTLRPSEAELAQFFNPAPTNLVITGQGTINPDYEIVSLKRGDNVWGEIAFQSPLAFVINDTLQIDPEISRVEMDSKPEELSYGTFSATLANHLPVGVLMTFFLGSVSDSTIFTNPATVRLGPYCLAAGTTDSNGFVSGSVSSTISDSLGEDALAMFNGDSVFFGQRIELLPTPSTGVIVSGADNIRVTARARIQILVGGN
jgi:hypothetical protein